MGMYTTLIKENLYINHKRTKTDRPGEWIIDSLKGLKNYETEKFWGYIGEEEVWELVNAAKRGDIKGWIEMMYEEGEFIKMAFDSTGVKYSVGKINYENWKTLTYP